MRRLFVVAVLAFIAPALRPLQAQVQAPVVITPDSMVAQLKLCDGSVLVGRVVAVTDSSVRVVSAAGESSIARRCLDAVTVTGRDRLHDGQLWPEDPSRTRLLFAPTGRMLRAGEAYLTDAFIFFPSVQVGVTDRFSIGVGASIIPGLSIDENILYFTPKVGVYQSPSLNVSVGALVATAKDLFDQSPLGLGYAVATVGDDDNHLTVGGGFGFSRGETASLGVLMVGGSARTGKNIALVSENYLATGSASNSILSGGVRFIGEKMSVDLALWGGPSVDTVVPYVAFIYRF